MSGDLQQRARAIFLELSTLDGPGVAAELDRLTRGDAELREAVVDLIEARNAASDAGIMAGTTKTVPTDTIIESPGSVIGPYRILQLIGEGGFGSVFLAEQFEPVRRRVALKIIKLGMDTKQVIARFEAERQAVALMDHPHIARVFGAGATESGRPYFAMEYVVGDAITRFSDAYKLDIPSRLALFTQVCSAVQHAHTKGVIHRDLKPANVLVSMVDGKPFAKVIDFGIAKATATPLTDKTLFTEHRQLIGTPEYMSPEQAAGSPDIDTRADVYALGVLLYELLTGVTPFDGKRLRSAAYAEMQRIIREEDPPAPSLRLNREVGRLVETAAVRKLDPPKLSTSIRGELDWVVMKALDKDRARRYATPAQLGDDIERHRKGEPVHAAPPSASYRFRKFVRRNKGAVITGSMVAVALLLGLIGTAWGWLESDQVNRLRAEDLAVAKSTLVDIVVETTVDTLEVDELVASRASGKVAKRALAEASIIEYRAEIVAKAAMEGRTPSPTELSDIGLLAYVARRRVKETVELRDQLKQQADRARKGVADMMSVLVGWQMGGLDCLDPDTGLSVFNADPLGSTIGFGMDLALQLKAERDALASELQQRYLAEANANVRSIVADAAASQANGDWDVLLDAIRAYRKYRVTHDESRYRALVDAFVSIDVRSSRHVWAESALRAGDLGAALTIALEAPRDRLTAHDHNTVPSITAALSRANPCELAVLAMTRYRLSVAEQEWLESSARIDQRLLGRTMTRRQHHDAAIRLLSEARAIMNNLDALNEDGLQWANDPDAINLIAEAASLVQDGVTE